MTIKPITIRRVVGVSYEQSAEAPLVMLKASGAEAEHLVKEATDVPVVRDPTLVNQLYRVPLDQPIGRELLPVMAVLLAHVLRMDRSQNDVEQMR